MVKNRFLKIGIQAGVTSFAFVVLLQASQASSFVCQGASDQDLRNEAQKLSAGLKKNCEITYSLTRIPGIGNLLRDSAWILAEESRPTCFSDLTRLSDLVHELDRRADRSKLSGQSDKTLPDGAKPAACFRTNASTPMVSSSAGPDTW